ncbi:hypothetical protein C4K68_17565 [Pokkaliibacter plantistimulans]|uniref:Lipoprotein n=1 Tax=Proteobacteria bacterium 228 TaxID=2083153 RepID=A0A2S5KMP8_9PROT|nr:hypothetical protein [Pokkaliibacter plantistimulans]PPC75982.1 hypothetical protein C4K68_17565 [Pokkaliibacter plantistimulans]
MIKNTIKLIVVSLLGSIVVGCGAVNTKPLADADLLSIKGKTLLIAKYEKLPDFTATTALNAQFGIVGAMTAISNGNEMIAKNNIKDPALAIASSVGNQFEKSYDMSVHEASDFVQAGVKPEQLAMQYKNYDYVLDISTFYWRSAYYRLDPNNYQVMYSANARLIDTNTAKVIFEDRCAHQPEYEDTDDAPSYAELEDGSGLRRSFDLSIKYCIDQIEKNARLIPMDEGKVATAQ